MLVPHKTKLGQSAYAGTFVGFEQGPSSSLSTDDG